MAKPFKPQVNIQPQTFSTGAPQQLASLADKLDQFASQTARFVAEKQIEKATIEGQAAGLEQQQAGGPLELKEETFIGGIARKAFNTAAREGYLKSLDNDNISSISAIANDNATNLAGFNDAVNAYAKGVMDNVDPASKSAVALSIDSMVARFRPRIQSAQAKLVVDQGNQIQAVNATERGRLAQTSSFDGDVEQAGLNLAAQIDSISNRSDIDTEEKANQIRDAQREEREASFSGVLARTFEDEGAGATQDALSRLDGKPPKGFTPDEWDTFIASEQKKVNRRISRQKQQNKEEVAAAKKLAKTARGKLFLDPSIPANPAKGSEDREDVNLAYDDISPGWQGLPEQDQINLNVDFVTNTGIIPDQMISNVNSSMRSGTVEQVGLMSDFISRVQEESPASLKDIPDESRSISLQVSDAVRAGIDPEVALEQARKFTFGLTDTEKDNIKLQTQAVSKDLSGDLQSLANASTDKGGFDAGIFGGLFSSVPDVPGAMDGDFRNSFSRFMNITGGNVDQSQKLAFQATKSVWAVTETGGPKRFMKYAPEVLYNVQGVGSDWIEDQFNEDMESIGAEGAIIATDNSVAREEQPSYPVLVAGEDGILEPLRDENNDLLRYKPDYKATEDFKDVSVEPGVRVESAQKQRNVNLERRANKIRRGVRSRVLSSEFIPPKEREAFLKSDEGKASIARAINNMTVAGRIDPSEVDAVAAAFDVELTQLQQEGIQRFAETERGKRAHMAEGRETRKALREKARTGVLEDLTAPIRAVKRTTKALKGLK